MNAQSLRQRLFRTKHIQAGNLDTRLKRCLTTFDLTLFGVGHMIGAGIYVLTGAVIKNTAGPSITVSFILAGFAALLSALCYAEFGARFPKAGSAYTYAYVGVGELWAFIIGWNILLEYMLGSAAVARSWSGYLDSLLGNRISNFTLTTFGEWGEHGSLIARYPDFVAVLVVIVATICVAIGSKSATNTNSFFTICNLLVITFVIGYGSFFADFSNWTGTDAEGKSRFVPYGWNGMLAGAASCFFAYIGFDGLATAGEEAKNPTKSIPIATYISMAITTVAYVLMSGMLSLMVPYEKVHPTAAFSDSFALHGATFAKYIVAGGALCGMTTSLLGGIFAMPRAVYAMAEDGLLFSFWAKVNGVTRTPVNASITFTILTCIIALFFDLEALVEFLSIGTLLAYSIVSACVIILRYQPAHVTQERESKAEGYGSDDLGGTLRASWLPCASGIDENLAPGRLVSISLAVMMISFFVIGGLLSSAATGSITCMVILALAVIVAIGSTLLIDAHHQNSVELSFKVFLVPYLPAMSLLINVLMMTHLSAMTWVRLAIWMTIGMAIYLLYGMRHSKEERRRVVIHPTISALEMPASKA